MSSNAAYVDQQVELESGTGIITGTVTSWSPTSIWVTFTLENGITSTSRFVRSQDGAFRQYRRSTDPATPALSFTPTPAPVAPEEPEEAPEEAPAPVAVTRLEFTEEQALVADRIARIQNLVKGWDEHETEARQKAATGSLDSFRIEALVTVASRKEPMRYLVGFLTRIREVAVIGEHGRVAELLDPDKAAVLLADFVEIATDRYEGWYRPNSTSNVDVEIKLGEHEAWQSVMRVATGKRFY